LAHDGNLVTKSYLRKFTKKHFGKALTSGCVNSFLSKRNDMFQLITALPQENQFLQVPREYFDEYVFLMHKNRAQSAD
jgi:hypothetical protein